MIVAAFAIIVSSGAADVAAEPVPDVTPFVQEASARTGVPELVVWAVIGVESRGNVHARSPKGAMGLMQLMPKTWSMLRGKFGLGDDPFDPHDNIIAGTLYLRYDHINVSIMRDNTLPDDELKFGWANTYPDDWQKYYVDKNCLRFDPVAQHARGNTSPFFWSQLPLLLNMNALQTGFLDLAAEAGLNNGIGLPFPGAEALRGGIALATSHPRADHLRDLNLLWAISCIFYNRLRQIVAIPRPRLHEPVDLTMRETDVLILSAKGETDRGIANHLGRSENTVNTHLRRIYRKLGAHTRLQAFSIAVKQHLIDIP